MKFPLIVLFLIFAAYAQQPSAPEREESLSKEQALLDLKKKALQEEIDRFEKERREWKQKQEAEILLRNTEDLGPTDLDRESRKRMVLNDAISKAFADFLSEEGRTGTAARQVVVLFQTDSDGKVKSVTFPRSEIPLEAEAKIKKILEKLDLSALQGDAAGLSYRFPLLIKK